MNETNINIKSEENGRKFKTILADPPWATLQMGGGKNGGYGAINHYDLMTIDQIKAMPVGELAEENAHLWLWVTNGVLEQGYDVIRAWGFEPRSIFTWNKGRLGLGVYLRNCTEHVLFATKGKAPIKFKAQPNWGFFPVQDHSHKPEEMYDIIERCSDGPYLELFARRPRNGWSAWGNEIVSDVVIPRFPVDHYSDEAYKHFSREEMDAAYTNRLIKDVGKYKKKG